MQELLFNLFKIEIQHNLFLHVSKFRTLNNKLKLVLFVRFILNVDFLLSINWLNKQTFISIWPDLNRNFPIFAYFLILLIDIWYSSNQSSASIDTKLPLVQLKQLVFGIINECAKFSFQIEH